MSLTADDLKKIAHLARLNVSEDEAAFFTPQLSHILGFVEQMNEVNTDHIAPLTNPVDLPPHVRLDAVTEPDQRSLFQALAPQVVDGLYLVPQVIEG